MDYLRTENGVVVFTIRWLIQLYDLVSYKATKYLVVLTKSDSYDDLVNSSIRLVTLTITCQ